MAWLKIYTLSVRARVSRDEPFAIGLQLSDKDSRELINEETLQLFRRWLADENCYVFTINGFPFGRSRGPGNGAGFRVELEFVGTPRVHQSSFRYRRRASSSGRGRKRE